MEDQNYIREVAERIRLKVGQSALPTQNVDELFDTYAVLALAKGLAVTNEDVHNAWSAWATKNDPDNKSLVPFTELSSEVQHEDARFTKAIHDVAAEISDEAKR